MTFKALLATKPGKKIETNLVELDERDLMPGDVTISVEYSTVNYKDALAITGYEDVIKKFPLIPGIDLAGIVKASTYPGIDASSPIAGGLAKPTMAASRKRRVSMVTGW